MMLLDHRSPGLRPPTTTTAAMDEAVPAIDAAAIQQQQQQQQDQDHLCRKRKADTQETSNERLSKRLSLLNLEHNGTKLYVPVEDPSALPTPPATTISGPGPGAAPLPRHRQPAPADDSVMQLDDTKHKVYIYNIDDELSSSSDDDGDAAAAAGRLVFLPDIERHLRARRRIPGLPPAASPPPIPRPVPPSPDGELAGMQLVLYGVPASLTVPEERDSVRKAIIEARQRHRDRQRQGPPPAAPPPGGVDAAPGAVAGLEPAQLPTIPEVPKGPVAAAGYPGAGAWAADPAQQAGEEDADAMDID